MALIVLDIVKLQKLLADVVVAAFHFALCGFDHASQHLRLNRNARLKLEPIGDGAHTVASS